MKRSSIKRRRTQAVIRAIMVLSAVGIITTGVTFAAIQSKGNALTGNIIQTASASLQIRTVDSGYGDSAAGFTFSGIVPGGPAVPAANSGYQAILKNTGDAPLAIKLTIPADKQPVVNGVADMSKVYLLVSLSLANGGVMSTQSIPLSALIAGQVAITNNTITPGGEQWYKLQVRMDGDAVTASSASITNLDLSFSGSPVL